MAGKNNSESIARFAWGGTPKSEDTTPKKEDARAHHRTNHGSSTTAGARKNDSSPKSAYAQNHSGSPQQPVSTASKPKTFGHEATRPVSGAAQPLSSAPQKSTKEPLYLADGSLLVTDYSQNLGRGSFGTVYAGTYDGSPCAVKIFQSNKTKLQKIEKEAQMSFLQTHDNLVQVYGLCRQNSRECLVMERCTTSLTAYLDKQRGHQQYTVKFKLSSLHQIIQGMLYLHPNQIVRGDLSPGNVLLQLEGPAESPSTFIVKTADFGQSRLLNSIKTKQLTSTHGKDDFMPPEVLKASNGKYLLSESDVFSFGCLVPYVAACVYPDPKVQAAKGSSELNKRMRYIQNSKNAIEPVDFKAACEDEMTECLHDKPGGRPSFQHISAVLGPPVKRYVDKGYSATEEERIAEIVKLKDEFQSKTYRREQLQEEKVDIEHAHTLLQRKSQALKTESDGATETMAKLQAELNSLQVQVDSKKASSTKLTGLGVGLGSVIGDTQKLQKETDDAVRRMVETKTRNTELEKQCQGLKEQVDDLTYGLKQMTTKKNTVGQERTKLAEEKYSLEVKLQSVQEAHQVSSRKCIRLQDKVSQLDGEVQAITTSRDDSQARSQNLAEEKKELQDSLWTTKEELAASRRKVKEQDAELDRLKTDVAQLTDETSELEKQLSAERAANRTLEKDLKELNEARTKADLEVHNKTSIINFLREEASQKEENYRELLSKYSTGVLEHGKENYQLTEELKESKADHEKVTEKYLAATKKKEELSEKVKELNKKMEELTDTVTSKKGLIKAQQERIKNLEKTLKKSSEENSTLEQEEKRLTGELAKAETERDALKNSEANNEASILNNRRTSNQQAAQLDSVMEERKELEMMNTRAEAFLQQCDKQCESMKKDLEELRGMLEKARKTEELTSQWTEIKDQTIKEFNERNMFLQRECHRLEKEALSRHAETVSKSELQVQQLKQEHEHLKATHSQCEELGRKKRSLDKQEKKIQRQKEANMKEVVQILRKDQMAANNLGDTSFSKESLDHIRREVTEEVVTAMKDQQELALEEMKRDLKAAVEVKQGRIQQMETELRYSEAAYRQLENKLKSLAERFFCAQRYPFFLHNMQVAGLPELEHQTQQHFQSDVSISDVKVLGQGFTFVKSVLDLPDAAIDDLFKAVQKATREKLHLALSATFYNFKGKSKMITFHRFHIISVSCILVRAEWSGDVGRVQPTPLYLHASVDIDKACLLHSTPHAESLGIGGLYYLTQMQGQKEQFKQLQALSSGALVVKKETGTVHEISKYLDRKLYTHTVEKYSSLASPSVDVPKVQVKKMATR